MLHPRIPYIFTVIFSSLRRFSVLELETIRLKRFVRKPLMNDSNVYKYTAKKIVLYHQDVYNFSNSLSLLIFFL